MRGANGQEYGDYEEGQPTNHKSTRNYQKSFSRFFFPLRVGGSLLLPAPVVTPALSTASSMMTLDRCRGYGVGVHGRGLGLQAVVEGRLLRGGVRGADVRERRRGRRCFWNWSILGQDLIKPIRHYILC